MHQSYNLEIDGGLEDNEAWRSIGQALKIIDAQEIRDSLTPFLKSNGRLDGSAIQDEWFPEISNANVFISHAHADEETALILAGELFSKFNLRPFIDSCVWGHSKELLKMIDNEFCWSDPSKKTTYDYNKRNGSTAHVHMMLASAIAKMIDRCECVFFLNTPQSITSKNAVAETNSPWLFYEIGMLNLIRKRPLSDYRDSGIITKEAVNERKFDFSSKKIVDYNVNLEGLTTLGIDEIDEWRNDYTSKKILL